MEKWIVNPVGGHVVRRQVEKAKTGPVAGKAMDSEVFTHRPVDWIYLKVGIHEKRRGTLRTRSSVGYGLLLAGSMVIPTDEYSSNLRMINRFHK